MPARNKSAPAQKGGQKPPKNKEKSQQSIKSPGPVVKDSRPQSDNVVQLGFQAPVEEMVPKDEQILFSAAKSGKCFLPATNIGFSNQSSMLDKHQKASIDLRLLKAIYKHYCKYDLKLEYGKSIILQEGDYYSMRPQLGFPYVKTILDENGQFLKFYASDQRAFNASFLSNENNCVENEFVAAASNVKDLLKDQINDYLIPESQKKTLFKVAMQRRYHKVALFFNSMCLAAADMSCWHFQRESFSFNSSIPIVNNMHIQVDVDSVRFSDIKTLKWLLLKAVGKEPDQVQDFTEILTHKGEEGLPFIMAASQIINRENDRAESIYQLSQPHRYLYSSEHDFYKGIHIDKNHTLIKKKSTFFCKDPGVKEGFQSYVLSAVNYMLKIRNMADILQKGFVCSSNFLMNWLYHNFQHVRQEQFKFVCQRFISAAGMDFDIFCGTPIGLTGALEEIDQDEIESSVENIKHKYAKLESYLTPQLMMCYDIVEEHCRDKAIGLAQVVEQADQVEMKSSFYEAQLDFVKHIAVPLAKDQEERASSYYIRNPGVAKEENLEKRHKEFKLDTNYLMVEIFNNGPEHVYVYSLLALLPDGDPEISFLKVLSPAKYKDSETGDKMQDPTVLRGDPEMERTDLQNFIKEGNLERKFIEDSGGNNQLRHQKTNDNIKGFWDKIYESINKRDAGIRDAYRRLADLLDWEFGDSGVYLTLEYIQQFKPVSVKFYGIVEVVPKDKDLLWEYAHVLRLAGSEISRHVKYDDQTLDKMFTVIKDIKKYLITGMKGVEKTQFIQGNAPNLEHQNHVTQLLKAFQSECASAGIEQEFSLFCINQKAKMAAELRGEEYNEDPDALVASAKLQIQVENYHELMLAANMRLQKEKYIIKLLLTNISALASLSPDPQFVKKLEKLQDIEALHNNDAKLPFFCGFHHKKWQTAASGVYETLWPVYPVPHFVQSEDFNDILLEFQGVRDQTPYIKFNDNLGKQAVNMMQEVLKNLYGWLTSRGVFLNEQEFKHQAMQDFVVRNFLLFPLGYQWPNFENALLKVLGQPLKFLKGFMKAGNAGAYQSMEFADRQRVFREYVIRTETIKHVGIHSENSGIGSFQVDRPQNMPSQFEPSNPLFNFSPNNLSPLPKNQLLKDYQMYGIANFSANRASDNHSDSKLLRSRTKPMVNPDDFYEDRVGKFQRSKRYEKNTQDFLATYIPGQQQPSDSKLSIDAPMMTRRKRLQKMDEKEGSLSQSVENSAKKGNKNKVIKK